jgi:hypothetical protein
MEQNQNGHDPSGNGTNGTDYAGMPNNEYSFYSEEVQEVLNRTPTWIERSGNILLLTLLVLGLTITSFIRYPDIVQIGAEIMPGEMPIIVSVPNGFYCNGISMPDSAQPGQVILSGSDLAGKTIEVKVPVGGRVTPLVVLKTGQYYEANIPLLSITPPNAEPKVRAFIPEAMYNRVALEQKILVKYNNGHHTIMKPLRGVVSRKSVQPVEGYYEVGVDLDDNIADNIVHPQPVAAMLVFEEKRLVERIFRIF